MSRIRSIPSRLPSWHPNAKHESVGYAMSPPWRTRSTICPITRGCGLSGCTSKYLAMLTTYRHNFPEIVAMATSSGHDFREVVPIVRVRLPACDVTGRVSLAG